MVNRKRNSPSDVDEETDFQTFRSRKNHKLNAKLKRLTIENETGQDNSHDDNGIHETTPDMTIDNTHIEPQLQFTQSDGSVSSETSTETTTTMKSQSSGSGYITGDEIGQSTDRDGDDELGYQDLQQSDGESVHSLGHSHPPCAQNRNNTEGTLNQIDNSESQDGITLSGILRMHNTTENTIDDQWG